MATDIRQLLPTNVRAALLAGSAPSSINPYVTASALSSFGFVPYTGATADVNLGAFSLTSPTIYGSSLASGTLTLASTSNATKNKILFGTSAYDEVNNRLGLGITSPAYDFDLTKSVPASYVAANVQNTSATGFSFIETLGDNNTTYSSLNVFNSAGGVGTFYDNNTAGVATNSATLSFLVNENASGGWVLTAGGFGTANEKQRWTINQTSFKQAAATSGAITPFTFTNPANTNQTATSNIPNFRISGANKQWATGTVANQYWNYLTANTASFVGASTLSESVALQIDAATAGTNATITNNFALGLLAGTATIKMGNLTGSTLRAAIYLEQSSPSNANFALSSNTSSGTILNATSNLYLAIGTQNKMSFDSTSTSIVNFQTLSATGTASTSGAVTNYTFNTSTNTNQTATSNIPNFRINGANKQWATGTVPLQYFTHLTANTVSAVGASTFTNVYGLYVEAATAGTNATITNNYAAGFSGRVGQIGLGNSTYFGDLCGVKDDIANRQNTAFGAQAANKVASGGLNVAMGYQSLFTNVSGNNNVAIGGFTLYQATSNSNIAVGGYALYNLTTGQSNVALGYDTGGGVTIGSNNVFIGNGITGLTSSLNNNIILATNLGVERFRYNPTQGSASLFSFSPASTTANTASTEINIFRVNAATTSISTGALTTQRFTYLPSQTLAFTGASTATNVYGFYVEAATAGTNATITNNYAAGFSGAINLVVGTVANNGITIRADVGSTTYGAIYMGTVPSATNYVLRAISTITDLQGGSTLNLNAGGSTCQILTASTITSQVNLTWNNGVNLILGSTTGTKIGTATTQKISLWNATPDVQPTNAIAAAAFVANTSGIVDDTATWGGYTGGQIVAALKRLGALA